MVCNHDFKPITNCNHRVSARILRMFALRWLITAKGLTEVRRHKPELKMRKRERESVVGKIGEASDAKHGGPICVRPYNTDEKKLGEIARETGEGKAAIVRRMIRFALSDKQERFGTNRCRERLDWLIEKERQNGKDSGAADEQLDEIHERVARLETDLKIDFQTSSVFLRELYMMSSVSVAVQNILLSKIIEISTPGASDKEQSMNVADATMAKLIAFAIRDLDKCIAFHDIESDQEKGSDLYLAARIKVLQEHTAATPRSTPESEQL